MVFTHRDKTPALFIARQSLPSMTRPSRYCLLFVQLTRQSSPPSHALVWLSSERLEKLRHDEADWIDVAPHARLVCMGEGLWPPEDVCHLLRQQYGMVLNTHGALSRTIH